MAIYNWRIYDATRSNNLAIKGFKIMNRELIEKLAEQCRSTHGRGFGDGIMGEYDETFDEEKFAELIVLECAKIVDDMDDNLAIYDLFSGKANSKGDILKKHFGV